MKKITFFLGSLYSIFFSGQIIQVKSETTVTTDGDNNDIFSPFMKYTHYKLAMQSTEEKPLVNNTFWLSVSELKSCEPLPWYPVTHPQKFAEDVKKKIGEIQSGLACNGYEPQDTLPGPGAYVIWKAIAIDEFYVTSSSPTYWVMVLTALSPSLADDFFVNCLRHAFNQIIEENTDEINRCSMYEGVAIIPAAVIAYVILWLSYRERESIRVFMQDFLPLISNFARNNARIVINASNSISNAIRIRFFGQVRDNPPGNEAALIPLTTGMISSPAGGPRERIASPLPGGGF